MNLLKNIPALVVTGIILIVAFVFFALDLIVVSLPEDYSKASAGEINEKITIRADDYAIPYVFAQNEFDLFFSIGYLHAQNRLWQMEFFRKAGEGRLSEIFGEKTFDYDLLMRRVGIGRIADSLWKYASPKTKFILESYSAGVNNYVLYNKNKLSFEFGFFDYVPDKWEPRHSLIVQRVIALQYSKSFWGDIVFGEIINALGYDKGAELIPNYPEKSPEILSLSQFEFLKPESEETEVPDDSLEEEFLENLPGDISDISQFKKILGETSSIGSSAWLVSRKTKTGVSAILASDSHLPLSLPNRWYQIYAFLPDKTVFGVTVPGYPLFFAGRNDSIAWSSVSLMLDDCDFYIEKTDSTNPNAYFIDGEQTRYKKFIDTIHVKNAAPVAKYILNVERSSILTDNIFPDNSEFLNSTNNLKKLSKNFKPYVISFRWTGQSVSDETLALYEMNFADNWEQFKTGANKWATPAAFFTFADESGDVGGLPRGLKPARKEKTRANYPNPGWLSDFDWIGVEPVDTNLQIFNPAKNYIVAANNQLKKDFDAASEAYLEPPSRAERLESVLQYLIDDYSARDAQLVQNDALSPYSKKIMEVCAPILEKKRYLLSPIEKQALDRLKKWDYIQSLDMPEAAIFNVFFDRLIYNTFYDELKEYLYGQYVSMTSVPTLKLLELLESDGSIWFDDVNTPGYEVKDELVLQSFKDAVKYLKRVFKNDDESWSYGEIHKLKFKHYLSDDNFLMPSVTSMEYMLSGSNTTVNLSEWDFAAPFAPRGGVSMRFVADMKEDMVYCCLAGGQSGDPLSPNYADQILLWTNGAYIEIPFNTAAAKKNKLFLEITPER